MKTRIKVTLKSNGRDTTASLPVYFIQDRISFEYNGELNAMYIPGVKPLAIEEYLNKIGISLDDFDIEMKVEK